MKVISKLLNNSHSFSLFVFIVAIMYLFLTHFEQFLTLYITFVNFWLFIYLATSFYILDIF